MSTERKKLYRDANTRALSWILKHQESDGGLGPVETMSHYMLVPTALLTTGRAYEAARLVRFLKRTFMRPEGGFDAPEIRAKRPSALAERGYAPSWMIYSSHLNLEFEMSMGAIPDLLRLQDPGTGGLFGSLEAAKAGKGIINPAVTSVACEASIVTGHIEQARRMGDHLTDNLIANNDLTRALYPVWDTERGLRTDDDAPTSPNMPRVVLRDEPNQHHFLTGMMIGTLVDLYRVTRDRKYFDAALQIFDFAVASGSAKIHHSTASHKFAWGAAWLYRETGDPRHLEPACRVCDYLTSLQEPDGSYVHWAFVKSREEWPYSPRLNITAQFTLWIERTLQLL